MSLVRAVEVPRLPVSRLEPVIGAPRYAELARVREQYVGDVHLLHYAKLLGTLIGGG